MTNVLDMSTKRLLARKTRSVKRARRARLPPSTEVKFFDSVIDNSAVSISSSGEFKLDSLHLTYQGTDEDERIGRKMTVRGVSLKGSMTPVQGRARFMLIVDKQCNGAVPAVTDVLETADIDSHRNLSNQNRFRVLWDRTYDTKDTGKTTIAKQMSGLTIPIEWSSTAGTIASIKSNNLTLLQIADGGLVKMYMRTRVLYTDL